MPLAAPPTRGYIDGQRVSNWDSPILYGHALVVGTSTETTTVLDVSRYAYLGGFDQVTTNPAIVVFNWYSDQAGTTLVGQRNFNLHQSIGAGAQYRLPNLGPFFKAQWSQILGGGTYGHKVELYGTNRFHPLEFIPSQPTLLEQQAVAFPGGNTPFYPGDYYAGPMLVWSLLGATVTNNLSLQVLNIANNWDFIDQISMVVAPGSTQTMIAPPGAWRFQAANSGAATTVYLNVVPSMSGAA